MQEEREREGLAELIQLAYRLGASHAKIIRYQLGSGCFQNVWGGTLYEEGLVRKARDPAGDPGHHSWEECFHGQIPAKGLINTKRCGAA